MSAPQSPFVSLAAFTPRAAAYFTGRERFAVTLAGAILRSRVTVLYGQSGSGKSSVLGAALPQAMRATLRRAAETTQRAPFRLLHFRLASGLRNAALPRCGSKACGLGG